MSEGRPIPKEYYNYAKFPPVSPEAAAEWWRQHETPDGVSWFVSGVPITLEPPKIIAGWQPGMPVPPGWELIHTPFVDKIIKLADDALPTAPTGALTVGDCAKMSVSDFKALLAKIQ